MGEVKAPRSLRRYAGGAQRLLKAWRVLEIIMKIHHFRRFLYSFQAFLKLSKGAGRLLRTFVSSEAPLLHPQPFRSTRGASAPQKNAYKQKAPMFCVIHENWWFVHKIRYFWSFLTLHGIQKAPEALVWLTNIQGCRGMAPGSYQCQKVKECHAYIHKGKRRRTYWRLSDFQRSSRILMIFWAIPWLQKGAGS